MKKLTNKVFGFILIGIVVIIGGLYFGKLIFFPEIVTPEEQEKRVIDKYNFGQLEKAKKILENILKDAKEFYTLKEFNSLYSADIHPTNNCYYVSNDNGDQEFIFGFMLESEKYIKKYGDKYYAYPKYDIPVYTVCTGTCWDIDRSNFLGTISHPCNKYIDNY